MKNKNKENVFAIGALAGLLFLFVSFLFEGATKMMLVWATVLVLAVLIGEHVCQTHKNAKRVVYGVATVAMAALLSGNLVYNARAELSVDVSGFTVSQLEVSATATNNSKSSVSASGGTITVIARGYTTQNDCNEDVQNEDIVTITVKNNTPAAVSYDLALSNVSGATVGTGLTLESGASLTMTVTSGKGEGNDNTGTITFSNVKSVSTGVEEETTFLKPIDGSYTVDGTSITGDSALTESSDHEYTLVATPNSGFKFYGWMSKCGGRLTTDASYTYVATEGNNDQVWPLFIKSDSAVYYIKEASPTIYYGYLDDALDAIGTGKAGTIVVFQTGLVYENDPDTDVITIPSGVSLIVPYVATNTTIHTATSTVEGGWNSTLEYANTTLISGWTHSNTAVANILLPDQDVTYTLTIPSDTTLNVNSGGKFVIGGTIASGHENTAGIVGGTAGAHSNVQLEGTLNVSGILSSCGYILGDGVVNVNSTGTVYQPFVFLDHRDGHYVSVSNDDKVFPFNRHTMLNIQSKIHLTSGGQIKGYADIYTQTTSAAVVTIKERHNVVCVPLIGQSGSLINLTAGTLDISYDPTRFANDTAHNSQGLYNRVGTTTLDFAGTATFASFSMTINVAASDHTLDTSKDFFPVPYNYIINLKNPETGIGTYTIQSKMKLMPGAKLTVDKDATLNVTGSLAIMDGLRDHGVRATSTNVSTWSPYHYPSTAIIKALNGNGVANLIVNGTLNVTGGLGGIVQTASSTGKIIMGVSATTSLTVRVGSPSASKIMYVLDTAVCGQTVYELPARLYNFSGTVFTLAANTTYVATSGTATNTLATYAYTYYNSSTSKNSTATNTITIDAILQGAWACETHNYVASVTAPKCLEDGYTSYKCHCGDSYIADEVEALGHNYNAVVTAPTCTADGYTTHTCSRCSDSYTDTPVTKLGHDKVSHNAQAPTCTEKGWNAYETCSRCDYTTYSEIAAKGHTEVIDAAVDATCTAPGKTEGKHCSVCGTVIVAQEEIPQLSHNYSAEITTQPTCTATGVKTYTCSACGDSYTETVDALGHNYSADVTDPTCTEDGYTTYTCSGCGDSYEEPIEASGHKYNAVVTDPTCTEDGYTTYTCTACGDTYTDNATAATGHSYGEWEVNGGIKTSTCSGCSETETRLVGAMNDLYSVQDVLFYNGTFAHSNVTDAGEIVFKDPNGNELESILGVPDSNGVLFLSYEMPSNTIMNVVEFVIWIDGVRTDVFTIDFDSYAKTQEGTDYETVAQAIVEYGKASSTYFGKAEIDRVTAEYTQEPTAGKSISADATSQYLDTYGASFVFDEYIAIKVYMSGNFEFKQGCTYQVGVLFGDATANELTVGSVGTACKAYVLYNTLADVEISASDWVGLTSATAADISTPPVLANRPGVQINLKSVEYSKCFAIRAYLIERDAQGNETVYYGKQVNYGLADYVLAMCARDEQTLKDSYKVDNPNAFKQFLIETWNYAVAAEETNWKN